MLTNDTNRAGQNPGLRRRLAGALLAAAAMVGAGAVGAQAAAPPQNAMKPAATAPARTAGKPNILFILVDDMGFADLSVMGNRKIATPHLDRMAREGVLMTRFYDAAPICSASRAGFFTGRFPAEVGFVTYAAGRASNAQLGQADWLDPKLPNVARMLKRAGYATAHIGKWHMGGGRDIADAPWPTAYGFDESLTTFEGLGPRVLVSDWERDLADQSAALGQGSTFWRKKYELTPLYADRTLEFVGRHKDQPWFVQMWLNDVHDPWGPDVDTLAATKGKGADPDDDDYLATVVRMDRTIGELVESLKDAGELDNTLIVVTSDNGPSSLQRFYKNGRTAPGSVAALRGRKWSNYEGGIRQPAIFYWPGHVRAGVRDDTTVGQGVDLLPTLAAVAGVKPPEGIDGIDLSPVLQGRPIAQRPPLFYAYGKAGAAKQPPQPTRARDIAPPFAVRDGRYKLLMNADGGNVQLYDLEADPGEATNLAATQPQRRDAMTAQLRRWMASLPAKPGRRPAPPHPPHHDPIREPLNVRELHRLMTSLAALAWCSAAGAQLADPPKTANPSAGTAGYTDPATIQGGQAYAGPITTRWGKAVTAANAWRSYPRPQMVRADWMNLNGEWDYALVKQDQPMPAQMQGKILVPFAVESKLSGVQKKVLPDDRIWYRRSFVVPAGWAGKRTLLHFGAVDFASTVSVNGAVVGSHKGGSDPFSFDMTPFLRAGANELVVQVTDPTSTGDQPRGKQTLEPRGIWYTAVSGIWQTVWLEPVPDLHIEDVRATPDIDRGVLTVDTVLSGGASNEDAVRITARSRGRTVATALVRGNRRAELAITGAHLWTPDDPFLYDLTVELVKVASPVPPPVAGPRQPVPPMTRKEADAYAAAKVSGAARDTVQSYFGMRKIAVGPHPMTGKPFLLLNNKPLFQNGTLDQGWWPESLLTPPSEEAARYDIAWLKKAGFNMLRKHIKVEPAQYYADADRMGMLIWQDMPSGGFGDQAVRPQSEREAIMAPRAKAQYQDELTRMMGALHNHPSIVMWVTNNEGWGQYDANAVAAIAKAYDPSRPVNATSGWFDNAGAVSAVNDIHTYEEVPRAPEVKDGRALVIGEYGGVGLEVPGHLWFPDRGNRIYQTAKSPADYLARYRRKFDEIVRQYQQAGLSAAVYTQTTDVEGELNGLLTYDRAEDKAPAATFAKMAEALYRPLK